MAIEPNVTISAHCNQPVAAPAGENRARVMRVLMLTLVFMAVEIITGMMTNSMALLADGWHMGTHAAGYGVALLAYALAARFANDARFSGIFTWGTWKIEVLGSFASSLLLFGVAIAMAVEATIRLVRPEPIAFEAALVVAVAGLGVNLLEMWWLRDDPNHGHGHGLESHHEHDPHHHHDPHHGHSDLNLRAAYVHAATDALTSIAAILALVGGRFLGWGALDPIAAILGSAMITIWAIRLARDAARVLLDAEMDSDVVAEVRSALEDADTRVCDLHVWRVGRGSYSVALSIDALAPRTPTHYRDQLRIHEEIVHATIEVNAQTAV